MERLLTTTTTTTTTTAKASHGPHPNVPGIKTSSPSSMMMPSSLTFKLAGDVVVGTGVTFLMAPFLSIVDKAIAQRASGTHTLMRSCVESAHAMVTNPVAYARNPAFLYVWAVYAATYTTANSLKTIVEHCEHNSKNNNNQRSVTLSLNRRHQEQHPEQDAYSMGKLGIFLGTSFANSGASVMKDRAFCHLYSADAASAVARTVPMASYGLWMSRDLIGVGSSFVLPDLLARKLSSPSATTEEQKRNRDMSQFCVPIATQFVAGPLHLLGLDLFNRPLQDMSFRQRLLERSAFLVNGYAAVVGARIARIIPGYGFGGVLNTKFRDEWREYLVERDATGMSDRVPALYSPRDVHVGRADRWLSLVKTMQNTTLEH